MWESNRDWQCYSVYKMGLLLAEGKMLKHLKEKPQHKTPYHDLTFLWRRTPLQTLRTQRNLKAYCATVWWSLLLLFSFSWELSTDGLKLTRENRNTRGNPVPVPLCPPQTPRGLARDRTRASALGSRRLTAWAMAQPEIISYTKENIVYEYFFAISCLCD
jgi:hypothetical protein